MLKFSGSRPANPCSLTEVWCSLPYPMDVYDVLDGVMISSYVLLHVCKDLPDCVAGFTEGWGGKILCCVCIVLAAYRMKAGSLSESWWYTLGSLFLFLAAGTTMVGCPFLRLFIGALAAFLSVSVWEYFWPVLRCRVLFCFVDFLVSSVFVQLFRCCCFASLLWCFCLHLFGLALLRGVGPPHLPGQFLRLASCHALYRWSIYRCGLLQKQKDNRIRIFAASILAAECVLHAPCPLSPIISGSAFTLMGQSVPYSECSTWHVL